jgi:hypothetical protein
VFGEGWIAAAYARRALSHAMIVRPRCAWCMEACCLFHAWYLAVSSLQSGIPCPTHTHTHTHTLTCLALPCLLRLMLLAVSRRRPVKKNVLTHQTHGVLRLNRSSSGCVTMSDLAVQARPGQTSDKRRDDNVGDQMTLKKGASECACICMRNEAQHTTAVVTIV